ncbi:MAG: SH3 domain-containing protein [Anaerolineae bacterium]|nr:MAG: SH3 domain-containing protein [Anaerolineae bacterium]
MLEFVRSNTIDLTMRRLPLSFFLLVLLTTACDVRISTPASTSTALPFVTPTLPPTLTPRPSATPIPPTVPPTVAPVEAITTTTVNVRSEPNTASDILGRLGNATPVFIIGKDASGSWYQILYEKAPEGKGWLAAAYVRTQGEPDVPVIGAGGESGEGASGLVTEKINVRSGPGTDFDSLGILNPNDVVTLVGRNASGTWLQIVYAAGPEGKGWIAAGYVQVQEEVDLPIVTEEGAVVGTGTPTPLPPTPTPTLVPAPPDDDSAQSPAVHVVFSPAASRAFSYSSDLSSPQGDSEDWVEFTFSTPSDVARVLLSLTCQGNGEVRVELWQDGQKLDDWGSLACGDEEVPLTLYREEPFLFRLRAVGSGEGLSYVAYTLTVRAVP